MIEKVDGKQILAAAVFISAVFVLGMKILNPTPLIIWSTDEDFVIQTEHIGDVYSAYDVSIIIGATLLICITGIFLFSYEQICRVVVEPTPSLPQSSVASPVQPLPEPYTPVYSEPPVSPLEERKRKWEGILPTLKEDQRLIYQTVLDADGLIPQSDIVEKTGLSKSNVSRSLDILESMGLIERRRRGMGNVILLK